MSRRSKSQTTVTFPLWLICWIITNKTVPQQPKSFEEKSLNVNNSKINLGLINNYNLLGKSQVNITLERIFFIYFQIYPYRSVALKT